MLLALAQSCSGNEGSAVLCMTPPAAHTGLLSLLRCSPLLHSFGWLPKYIKIRKVYIKKQRCYFVNKGPSSQGYDFSSSHVWMWELDYKESWAQKNWCFWTMVLEKTLENPLDCKEIQPVHPKGDQSWMFIGRTDVEAETPILWPHDVKSWLTGKDPDAGKDWRQEEKGTTEDEMVGWHHQLSGHEFGETPGVGDGQGGLVCCHPWSHRVRHDWGTELNWTDVLLKNYVIYFKIDFPCAGSSLLHMGFALVAESGGHSLPAVPRLRVAAASLVGEHGSRAGGLSTCSSWALELKGCGTWASLLHGRWDLPDQGSNLCLLHYHWATREVQALDSNQ